MSTSPAQAPHRRTRKGTAEQLLQAAAAEFNEHGFQGTDSNRIARRAGFAPQTFYRWFEDKTEIFIKVYEAWQREELGVVEKLLAEHAADVDLARAFVAHHRAYLRFRRSLRQLSCDNDQIRAARAVSRRNQIAYLKTWRAAPEDDAELAVTLLQLERLCDALAEGELADMGLEPGAAEARLAQLINRLRAG
jgi:AcrR family transcriptional regulator